MSNLFTTIKHILYHIMSRIRGVRPDSVNSTAPKNAYPYSITLSEEPIPPNRDDHKLLTALQRMDSYIEEGAGYAEWEAHFFSMQKICCKRYTQWLKAKGVSQKLSQEFPQCLEVYLAFLYQYSTAELKQVSPRTIKEFFMDFLPPRRQNPLSWIGLFGSHSGCVLADSYSL